jgi:holo-[acyl-carrier protein] synthase
MEFPFKNCIVSAENLSIPQARELLQYNHGMAHILLDLQRFEEEMQKLGEEYIVANYLSNLEQEHFGRLTSAKRKREWLGGRFSAKYAAAEVLSQNGNTEPWASLAVIADENGRPLLATDNKSSAFPDISISHSGDLAAAMAVSKGFCGVDIQKITGRVVKVRKRFCTQDEEQIVQSFAGTPKENLSSLLTKLWAAKEALRKVANAKSLPGFLELELTEIFQESSQECTGPWIFSFIWKHSDINHNPAPEKCSVVVTLKADYALALTISNDTLG